MAMQRTAGVVLSLLDGRWLESEEAAVASLQRLGFTVMPDDGTVPPSGSRQRELMPATGIDHASLSILGSAPTNITFFIASAPERENAATRLAYENLLASLAMTLDSPQRFWADETTPVFWHHSDLEVGAQLFDRRDSTVMVWVEHRARSKAAEGGAFANRDPGSR
ncbi:hypothetical protein GCM10009750_10660 [Agromyces salentinus]|uniref:Uncharacterized protein n=2 Tax=Agromyces salentinus TaxID=269421 RepID=A0ABP4YRX0_9MICO